MLLEVIATNLNDAINIEKYGGDRIELAVNMEEGGLTPPIELTREVCEAVEIPVYVMVRPHGKSFIYDEEDKKTILNDIKQIAKTKAKGDRKSTRLNSSHVAISYAVFCLKKKKI